MKNLIKLVFIVFSFSLVLTNISAQEVEVTSNEVLISGFTRLDPTDGQYTEIYVDNTGYYGGSAIRPEENNASNIGTSSKAFRYVYSYNLVQLSDERQKENISKLDSSLALILALKGVKYDLKKEYSYDTSDLQDEKAKEKLNKEQKDVAGLIAQDVEKVIPNVVVYDDETDIYGIDYTRIIPYLIEAIKEQQKTIESMEKEIDKLKK